MTRLSKAQRQAWRALFATQALVQRRTERALAEAGLPGIVVYDLLYRLYLADGRRLRMHELADDVVISRSGLTRLADRLEKDGLIERRSTAEDRRGCELALLPAGVDMLRRQWAVYAPVIAETFAANVRDPRAIVEQLEPVVEALGFTLPPE